MANYELYLWEPELDLTSQEWQELENLSDEDEGILIRAVRTKIAIPYQNDARATSHIEKFYQLLIQKVTDPRYFSYFEGYIAAIERSYQKFKQQPYSVLNSSADWIYTDDANMARVLIEAIAQSGVCAYHSQLNTVFPSDEKLRTSNIQDQFYHFPALILPEPNIQVLNDKKPLPRTVLEMKDYVIEYIAQHPLGKDFKILAELKSIKGSEKYYWISFYKELNHTLHKFNLNFSQKNPGNIHSFLLTMPL